MNRSSLDGPERYKSVYWGVFSGWSGGTWNCGILIANNKMQEQEDTRISNKTSSDFGKKKGKKDMQ